MWTVSVTFMTNYGLWIDELMADVIDMYTPKRCKADNRPIIFMSAESRKTYNAMNYWEGIYASNTEERNSYGNIIERLGMWMLR